MFKKKLLASAIAGVAGLGLSTAVLANGGSYNDAGPAMGMSPSDSAFYVGLQGGYGDTHWDNEYDGSASYAASAGSANTFSLTSSSKDGGFAGRIFAGYSFNKFLGVEGGWTYLPRSRVTTTGVGAGTFNTTALNFTNEFKIKNYAFDLLGVLTAPLGSGLSVHAKAGLGYLHSSINDNATANALFANGKDKAHHWGPAVGVGADYEVMQNLFVSVDWMRFAGNGKVNPVETTVGTTSTTTASAYQPNPDVVLAGISYHFPINF